MNTVLFDLDGTLLPMDQDAFVELYAASLSRELAEKGLDPKPYIKAVFGDVEAVARSGGNCTNEQAFRRYFISVFGEEKADGFLSMAEAYYTGGFVAAKAATRRDDLADVCVKRLLAKNYRVALATNPIFPRCATLERIKWAGLDAADFELITTYETDCFVKPSPSYFSHVAQRLGVHPKDCLMVGNNAEEDLPAAGLGMDVFLLTHSLINDRSRDLSDIKTGSFADLFSYLDRLPDLNGKFQK